MKHLVLKILLFVCATCSIAAFGQSSRYPPVGGAGITSINGNTTAAQVIHAGTGISVSSSSGTTTVTNTEPGAPLAIGESVGSGTPYSILYINASGKLAQDADNFFYDNCSSNPSSPCLQTTYLVVTGSINTTGGTGAIDVNNSDLDGSGGVSTLNWANGVLSYDVFPISYTTLNWFNGDTYDSNGLLSLAWLDRQLFPPIGLPYSAIPTVDYGIGQLNDASGGGTQALSLDWTARAGYDFDGILSIMYGGTAISPVRALFDNAGSESEDWQARTVIDPVGDTQLDWSNIGYLSLPTATVTTGSSVGTLTNAPSSGNPVGYLEIEIDGTLRHIPFW